MREREIGKGEREEGVEGRGGTTRKRNVRTSRCA